ncbi:hypothetical protein E0L21_00145 [Kosakonia quasisacchari]|uniref:Uncharacterized protein n=1 Tax=Kosakonia quasisacchari TaxID=2529380 RepID=A0A4R0HW30_9ENTR|nr:hypothetical protein E0L21_00145 [Kosakonia quasisacchari]
MIANKTDAEARPVISFLALIYLFNRFGEQPLYLCHLTPLLILFCRWTAYFKLPLCMKKVTVSSQKTITVTARRWAMS